MGAVLVEEDEGGWEGGMEEMVAGGMHVELGVVVVKEMKLGVVVMEQIEEGVKG